MPKKKPPSPIELAARIYGCDLSDLLAYHEFEDGSVAIIAPTGQKFTYSADRLLQETLKSPTPAPSTATHSDIPPEIPSAQVQTARKRKSCPAPDTIIESQPLIDQLTDP